MNNKMLLFRLALLVLVMKYNFTYLSAQHPSSFVPGEILVSLIPDAHPNDLNLQTSTDYPAATRVSEMLNIWLVYCPAGLEQASLEQIRRVKSVRYAQLNHFVQSREVNNIVPDDPKFMQQWYLNNSSYPGFDLGMTTAWDITTGGVSPAGDTIVIAVIDGSLDINHSDWGDNLWVNQAEIPDDLIDNDNNGYIDDIHGWNTVSNSGIINSSNTAHGTQVSGIIAAKGNNNIGISGINWNTKLMFVARGGGSNSESFVLAAFDYVKKMRQRYNDSDGTEGAFVTALNCSFGIDGGKPEDHPLWCAAYDEMGHVGILSAGATSNDNVNVEEVGDIPTNCPSDYLIGVTSITATDQRDAAGWGPVSVDLATYGVNILTTSSNDTYFANSGTSLATPQVTGAIGLLYGSPCTNLIALAKLHPDAAALMARKLLLESVRPLTSLNGYTVTGGKLHIGDLISQYENDCQSCPPPYWITTSRKSTTVQELTWLGTTKFQQVNLRWRKAGETIWNEVVHINAPYWLSDLTPCTTYEFVLKAECNTGSDSDWSSIMTFTSDGCCDMPTGLKVLQKTDQSAHIGWDSVTAAIGWRVRYAPEGAANWTTLEFSGSTHECLLDNLDYCQNYQVQVQTVCDTGATAFCQPLVFRTNGCGSCTEISYCPAKATFPGQEWIALVTIGDNWANASGSSSGYENFTGTSDAVPEFWPNQEYSISLTPGFSSATYKEYFRVFIDYNQNGDFNDPGEVAFDPGFAHDGVISGTIKTPAYTLQGLTRMRVFMQYQDQPSGGCKNVDYGEVEDYCVYLNTFTLSADEQPGLSALRIYPVPATDFCRIQLPLPDQTASISLFDLTGKEIKRISAAASPVVECSTADLPAGYYLITVQQAYQVWQARLIIE